MEKGPDPSPERGPFGLRRNRAVRLRGEERRHGRAAAAAPLRFDAEGVRAVVSLLADDLHPGTRRVMPASTRRDGEPVARLRHAVEAEGVDTGSDGLVVAAHVVERELEPVRAHGLVRAELPALARVAALVGQRIAGTAVARAVLGHDLDPRRGVVAHAHDEGGPVDLDPRHLRTRGHVGHEVVAHGRVDRARSRRALPGSRRSHREVDRRRRGRDRDGLMRVGRSHPRAAGEHGHETKEQDPLLHRFPPLLTEWKKYSTIAECFTQVNNFLLSSPLYPRAQAFFLLLVGLRFHLSPTTLNRSFAITLFKISIATKNTPFFRERFRILYGSF